MQQVFLRSASVAPRDEGKPIFRALHEAARFRIAWSLELGARARAGGESGCGMINLREARMEALEWPGHSACIVESWYRAQTDLMEAA